MSIEIAGWRACSFQSQLDPSGFFELARAARSLPQLRAMAPQTPVRISANASPVPAGDLVSALERFARGGPECEVCPLAGGAPVGCYRRIEYPLDAVFEEQAFAWALRGATTDPASAASAVVSVVLERGLDGASWDADRGTSLERAQGLETTVHVNGEDRSVTSAAVMEALWSTVEADVLRDFLRELLAACDARLASPPPAVRVTSEVVEVAVAWDGDPARLADAFDPALHDRIRTSTTLAQVRAVDALLTALREHLDWQILVWA